jgi:hypothetical protein
MKKRKNIRNAMKDIDKEYWDRYKVSQGNWETLIAVIVSSILIAGGYYFGKIIGAFIAALITNGLLIISWRDQIINRNYLKWEIDEWPKIIKTLGITDDDLRAAIAEINDKYDQERKIRLNNISNRIK